MSDPKWDRSGATHPDTQIGRAALRMDRITGKKGVHESLPMKKKVVSGWCTILTLTVLTFV